MAFRGIAIFPALVLLASCGSATLKNPDGSAGNGGATDGGGGSGGAACGTCMACSPAAGTCLPVANGTTCNDGNACTQTDTCQSGTCTGSNPVTCATPTACQKAGTCNSSTGVCSMPNAPDNTSCTSSLYGSCQSGACACYQGVSPVTCTTGASCMNWGFESGTAEGWGMDAMNPALGVTNITVSSSHFHTGSRSLAVTIGIGAYSPNSSRAVSVAVPLCASSGTANLSGYTFSAWVYFTVTQGSIPMNAANLIQASVRSTTGFGDVAGYTPVSQSTINQWLQVQGDLTGATAGGEIVIYVDFPLASVSSEGFAGTMYVDDVQITPP
jgi:hypothetical protein